MPCCPAPREGPEGVRLLLARTASDGHAKCRKLRDLFQGDPCCGRGGRGREPGRDCHHLRSVARGLTAKAASEQGWRREAAGARGTRRRTTAPQGPEVGGSLEGPRWGESRVRLLQHRAGTGRAPAAAGTVAHFHSHGPGSHRASRCRARAPGSVQDRATPPTQNVLPASHPQSPSTRFQPGLLEDAALHAIRSALPRAAEPPRERQAQHVHRTPTHKCVHTHLTRTQSAV